jgi:hypothetical protein
MMRILLLAAVLCLSGCSWFHKKRPVPPDPPQLIVTGAPLGSVLLIDGLPVHAANEPGDHPQTVNTTPGTHELEVKSGEAIVYRENLDVAAGEKRVITVLSGSSRY